MVDEFTFSAALWRWQGEAAWHFVSLPAEVSDEIEERFGRSGGFGSVRVRVHIGASTWSTSLFPDSRSKTYLLPIKKAIRSQEDLEEGALLEVTVVPET